MPEGDTIHKIAAALRPRLEGAVVELAWLNPRNEGGRLQPSIVGAVYARGKHLFIELGESQVVRSHLGMYGDWHRYRPGEPWRRPERQASLAIWTARDVFVCFNAKEVQVFGSGGITETNIHRRLGPDLLGTDVDFAVVTARAREFLAPDAPLVDLLLDQRVASGIGNVYKSEVLFIEKQSPFSMLGALVDDCVGRLFRRARQLLQQNLGSGPRITRFVNDTAGPVWVYRRAGRPCLRCDDEIQFSRAGRDLRAVYWCASCQQGNR